MSAIAAAIPVIALRNAEPKSVIFVICVDTCVVVAFPTLPIAARAVEYLVMMPHSVNYVRDVAITVTTLDVAAQKSAKNVANGDTW
jgi:hypothetical protein